MKKTIVIFAALALVFGFAATTMAADWNFYGSARVTTFSYSLDKDAPANPMPATYDDTDTTWALQGNSRVGATVSNGDVGGGFEYGTGVNVRKLYGTWNFGSGQLLVGQTYTPITSLLSNQVGNGDNGLLNVGEMYAGRQPMLQLTMGGFQVALISPSVASLTAGTGTLTTGGLVLTGATGTKSIYGMTAVDTDVTIPKIELAYKFSTDMFWVKPYVGYQTYDAVTATDTSESIDAYVGGVAGAVTFGPATVKANIYMAQNPVAYGATSATAGAPADAVPAGVPVWNATKNEFDDYDEFGGLLMVGFKINDMLGAELGYAYKKGDRDTGASKTEYTNMAYYAQLPITLADGVFIVPEIGYYDFGDAEVTGAGAGKTERGSQTYFGAKWQINF